MLITYKLHGKNILLRETTFGAFYFHMGTTEETIHFLIGTTGQSTLSSSFTKMKKPPNLCKFKRYLYVMLELFPTKTDTDIQTNTSISIFVLTLSGWGGGGLRGSDDQIQSYHLDTSYPTMPKLCDFLFLSLRHAMAKF